LGQSVLGGQVLTLDEIDRTLSDLELARPTINISGVTTEPLTHPDAAGIIRAVRRRKLPLGLYTKGRRLDASVRRALLDGDSEAFVTVSVDSVTKAAYIARHGIAPRARDGLDKTSGGDYFDIVLDNLKLLKRERDAAGSSTTIRAAFLLFADGGSLSELIVEALRVFGPHVDLLRFAFPQMRNDGRLPGQLPESRFEILAALAKEFADVPKVRILTSHANPQRNESFRTCRAQRFQLVIDRAGNAFPCSEVAVQPYKHLSYGNIRDQRLPDLLVSAARRALFGLDIDRDMRCRVCNRRDEAVNTALESLSAAFDSTGSSSTLN
jgi:radical SAM protein with 4Fe4S-binding SPASM domain